MQEITFTFNIILPTLLHNYFVKTLLAIQLLKKLDTFYGTQRFIAVVTRSCHWTPYTS